MTVVVNGGLRTVPQVTEQLEQVDGVMLGREAYHNPFLLPALHRAVHDDGFLTPDAESIVASMRALRRAPGRGRDAIALDHAAHAGALQRPHRRARLAARAQRRHQPAGRDARADPGGAACR